MTQNPKGLDHAHPNPPIGKPTSHPNIKIKIIYGRG